ncbi:VOC family protein [Blastococcus sp. SYSU DS0539]
MADSPARFKDLCLDARDHQSMADWWAAALGYVRKDVLDDGTERERDWPALIIDPAGAGPDIWLNPVIESKWVKNRMHLDVVGDRDALVAAGARVVRSQGGDIDCDVLADPEGNEFCCFPPED